MGKFRLFVRAAALAIGSALGVVQVGLGLPRALADAEGKASFPKPLVLVTGFEPFGGSTLNISYEVAAELAQHPDLISHEVDVRVCRLPVVYDKGAEVALECLKALPRPPALVVSMGEGGCDFRLETAASNLDDAYSPDNSGVSRKGRGILSEAPARLGFSFPVQALYCALSPAERRQVLPSISPGYYVCNNTAFRLSWALRAQKVPYAFIHVPNSRCGEGVANVPKSAALIGRLIDRALSFNNVDVSGSYPFPHSSNVLALPSTPEELELLLSVAGPGSPGSTECERRFLRELKEQYRLEPPRP